MNGSRRAGLLTSIALINTLASLAAASVITAPETTVESRPSELVRIAGMPAPSPKTPDATGAARPGTDEARQRTVRADAKEQALQ